MTTDPLSLDGLAAKHIVPPSSFQAQPERVVEIADIPLDIPDVAAVVAESKSWGFYDPERVEDAVIGLAMGHMVLAGPPGTGKTKLATHLSHAFGASLLRETANAEWSVYDVVGTLSIDDKGATTPRHGLVTNSVLQCADTVVRNLDTGKDPKATWLLIDEINRAEIDRAFGALFTALSGEDKGSYTLDYVSATTVLTLPRRFRIICTMNDYDTRFVNSMSSALRRRFGRVLILPPPNVAGQIPEGELDAALANAATIATARLGKAKSDAAIALLQGQAGRLREIFGALRGIDDVSGIPVGTAQVVDSCIFAAAFISLKPAPTTDTEWWRVLDRVISTRLVSGLESDSTRLRIDENYVKLLAAKLPHLSDSVERIAAFLHGGR